VFTAAHQEVNLESAAVADELKEQMGRNCPTEQMKFDRKGHDGSRKGI
jgi:hypothetical protein